MNSYSRLLVWVAQAFVRVSSSFLEVMSFSMFCKMLFSFRMTEYQACYCYSAVHGFINIEVGSCMIVSLVHVFQIPLD